MNVRNTVADLSAQFVALHQEYTSAQLQEKVMQQETELIRQTT